MYYCWSNDIIAEQSLCSYISHMQITCKSHDPHTQGSHPARSGPVCWGQWHGLSDRSLALPQRCTAHRPAWGEEEEESQGKETV